MPVPYQRREQRGGTPYSAGYIDVIWLSPARTFFGGLLLIDRTGQPYEFVHNKLEAPSGFLWPAEQVRRMGVAALCHSLFEACRREPELLVCRESLGPPEYCKTEIAPSVPFAQVSPPRDGTPATWTWVNDPPRPAMPAQALSEALQTCGLMLEPFERIRLGLREVYPQAPWEAAPDDRVGRAS